ncbi:Anhydro-N-acetylmuramic acid kinase [Nitrospira sp. KM1]|uniref:anhydro-N-acetylmuramic acid kinase n=1 Tax=Nitrospira sp. KM1 TaxID=1936990 RepID=UPI0013A74B7C|nr:anhydro-N-acetylmuramic acid kinase [Nitrospira sp. KM1]BCA55505.1 Anhydro-N-acetylmuramic acid kinase [Nitrospira sp. KM1]
MKIVGLMSGTSGDGVDAALVDITGRNQSLTARTLAAQTLAYPRSLQQRILTASVSGTVADICHLNALLGEWFADAALQVIRQAKLRPADIALIGSHGQTVHHLPYGIHGPGVGAIRSTLQIAEPAVIAERTGITTIANFRPRDIAAGGQGAPLTPSAHTLLLRHSRRARLIVNLGGISNVTYVPSRASKDGVLAFDTGPANIVLDSLVARVTKGRMSMDRDGKMALKGTVDTRLLGKLLAHPFLSKRPPKSTGREDFGPALVDEVLNAQQQQQLSLEDVLATCSMWTAKAVGTARRWITGEVDEVVVGGGGTRNRAIMNCLSSVFSPVPVTTFEALGWDSKSFEAVAFAVLAYQTATGQGGNIPAVTGATHSVLLGTIVPAGPRWTRHFHR